MGVPKHPLNCWCHIITGLFTSSCKITSSYASRPGWKMLLNVSLVKHKHPDNWRWSNGSRSLVIGCHIHNELLPSLLAFWQTLRRARWHVSLCFRQLNEAVFLMYKNSAINCSMLVGNRLHPRLLSKSTVLIPLLRISTLSTEPSVPMKCERAMKQSTPGSKGHIMCRLLRPPVWKTISRRA